MKQNLLIVLLVILAFILVVLAQQIKINLPGINQGYAPQQPLAFSHRLHSGDLQIDCMYCHSGADKSRHAGIPSENVCMNCHRFVTAGWDKIRIEDERAQKEKRPPQPVVSDELKKLYRAAAFDETQMKFKDKPYSGKPIEWTRVYNLPDFVFFDHRRHVNADVSCQKCHGAVETMEKVTQVPDLTMGWCVNCHRDVNNGKIPELKGKYASISCTVCHY
ncbi:MAG: cytochrome c3 family protein [Calditrichaeota bacterium]|nr:cytochrome c3 family protein [Calditrichota bacterium]